MNRGGVVVFFQFRAHERVGVLYAVHEIATPLDHSLVYKFTERFVLAYFAAVVKEFIPETTVDEMACGMFRASDVQIDLPPVFIGFTRHEGLFVVGVHISQIVCAGAGETGHGIQFEGISFRSMPLFGPTQRRFSGFGRQIFVDFGKLQRKVPVCRRDTVDIAYGYRFAPIALTAENRVAQAIIGLHLADTALLHIPFGGIHGFFHREAIEIQCGALGINHSLAS